MRDTAALVSYAEDGSDKSLYVSAEHLVRQAARRYNSGLLKRDLDEVLFWVRDAAPYLAPSSNADLVALSNGLFDLRNKELLPFSPEVVLSSKCEARWNQNSTVSPAIDGWDIDSWIKDIANEDEEVERLLWQVIVAIFRPDHAFDKTILLVSENGSNGKGTFLELPRNLVGRHRVATVSIADFDRQFIPIQLATSFAVLSDENSVGSFLKNSQTLKAWLTHDWITMDRRNRDAVQIKGRGLSVFCLNELPQSQDKTESLYRRFVPVPFKRRYMGAKKNPLIKSEYLKRPEVLDYVAQKALSMPLFEAFDVPSESECILDEIRLENDQVLQFVEEFLDRFVWDVLPWKFLHALYLAWMKQSNPSGRSLAFHSFIKRLSTYVKDHPERGWAGTRAVNGTPTLVVLPLSVASTVRGLCALTRTTKTRTTSASLISPAIHNNERNTTMSNLEELIKAVKEKHAAEIKALREQAAKEEQELLVRVARLVEEHEPERFAQYRDHAASLIEQEHKAREERAKAARERRKTRREAAAHDGGGDV